MVNIQKNIDTITAELVTMGQRRDTLTKEVEFVESEINRLKGCLEVYEKFRDRGVTHIKRASDEHDDSRLIIGYNNDIHTIPESYHSREDMANEEKMYNEEKEQLKKEQHFHSFDEDEDEDEEKINDVSDYTNKKVVNSADIDCKECGVSSSDDESDDDIEIVRQLVHNHKKTFQGEKN